MFQSSAGDKPRPLAPWRGIVCGTRSVSILGRGQAPAARSTFRQGASFRKFQSSAGDKPRPLHKLRIVLNSIKRFNPRPGTSPGRSQDYTAWLHLCSRFNPRPGTSPGRSMCSHEEVMELLVSILGRGQAPAARTLPAMIGIEDKVSILGRGQAPAAQYAPHAPAPGPGVSILGRGQAPAAHRTVELSFSSESFNPRPGTSPGRS